MDREPIDLSRPDQLPTVFVENLDLDPDTIKGLKRVLASGALVVMRGKRVVDVAPGPKKITAVDSLPRAHRKSKKPALDEIERDSGSSG
jgi:hypothetical protein